MTSNAASGLKEPLMKRVLVDMSATLLHHGHIRLLQQAKEMGHVTVALTTDEEILKHKGYEPELTYEQRKEILLALRFVDEVVPCPWLLTEEFFQSTKAEVLVHSGPNANEVSSVISRERTPGISTTDLRERAVAAVVQKRNSDKCLLTPGPTNLHPGNLFDINPVFTRTDDEYQNIQKHVLERIRQLAGQDSIVAMQGSATTAIEVATSNFLRGNVLVVLSGYYSQRLFEMIERKKDALGLSSLEAISYEDLLKQTGSAKNSNKFDWVLAAYTETADAFLADMQVLKDRALSRQAKLMIDATGSINLEDEHELADVCMFSSCKGLGGLTGASFISFNKELLSNLNPCRKDFILDLQTYIEKKTTGPAHTLCSLYGLSDRFVEMRQRVRKSKERFMEVFAGNLISENNQPALCTRVRGKFIFPDWVVPYEPRNLAAGYQVVCHLFDQFPSNRNPGEVYDFFELSETR